MIIAVKLEEGILFFVKGILFLTVCLIIVIKPGRGDQSGSLHVYQADTFPVVITHVHFVDVSNLNTVPERVLELGDGGGSMRGSRRVQNTTASPARLGTGTVVVRSRNGVQIIDTDTIEKLSRAWPLFKIIEMFSTCVGWLRCVPARLRAPVAAVRAGWRPVTALVGRVGAVACRIIGVVRCRFGRAARRLAHVGGAARRTWTTRTRLLPRVHVAYAKI